MIRCSWTRSWFCVVSATLVLAGMTACTGGGGSGKPSASDKPSSSTSPQVKLKQTDEATDGGKPEVAEVGYTVLDSYDGVVDVLAAAKITNTSKDDLLHKAEVEFVFTASDKKDTVVDNRVADLAPGASTIVGRVMTVKFKPEKLSPTVKDAGWYPNDDVADIGTDLSIDVKKQKIKPGNDKVDVSVDYETFDDLDLMSRLYANLAVRDSSGTLLGAAQLDTSVTKNGRGEHSADWEIEDYEWPKGASAKESDVILRCVTCLP